MVISANATDLSSLRKLKKERIRKLRRIRDMKKMTDLDYMRLSIEEMRKSIQESRNDDKVSPKVGAVLVRNDGSFVAAHRGELREGDHAEYTLLERKCTAENVTGTVVFTTLEPCCERHFPKVSCSQRLIEARIKKVYIGIEDPDPTVSGKGKQRLMDAGIEVAMYPPDLQKEIEDANREFLKGAFKRRLEQKTEDEQPILQAVPHTSLDMLQTKAVNTFLRRLGVTGIDTKEGKSALLQLQMITKVKDDFVPTQWGLLLFGKRPQLSYPNAVIRATYKIGQQEIDLPVIDGPLVEQSEKLYAWYKDKLKYHIDRSEPTRKKVYDVPTEVISELVKNAIIHRDYAMKGAPIYFEINDESIIIKSPGKPIEPITIPQIQTFNAPSLSRNPLVMFAFDKLDLAEQRGLGFETIRQMPVAQRPRVTFEDPYMVFTLPLVEKSDSKKLPHEIITQFVEANETFTRREFEEYLGVSQKTAIRQINKLIEDGLIEPITQGKNTIYQKKTK